MAAPWGFIKIHPGETIHIDALKPSDRYLALDVFRGMTVALMILVNTPGSWQYVYSPLRHASWHGCTLADLVFPFFLFAVGVSAYFSLARYAQAPDRQILWRIGRRVALIFILGLLLNAYPPWTTDYSHFRILGVLQRIALAYGLAAICILVLPRKWLPGFCGLVLMAYWGILYFFGTADPYSLHGNATIPLDRAIFGESSLYRGFGIPFEPEGLLSSLPAAVTVLIGYLTGTVLGNPRSRNGLMKFIVCGAAFTAIGYLWGFLFPINKPLWTSSYVLFTAGLAILGLALLIYLIDCRGYTKWTPLFSVFGKNPLFLFVLSIIWAKTLRLLIRLPDGEKSMVSGSLWLYSQCFVPLAGYLNGSLLYALAHVAVFWVIGFLLNRYGIFIKV